MSRPINIDVDARGRAALGKVATQGTYRASLLESGTIMLEPVVTMTKAELALNENPFALAEMHAALRGEDLIEVEADAQLPVSA